MKRDRGVTGAVWARSGYTPVTWADCTLRDWLNGEFLNTAFTSEEQAMLRSVVVSADVEKYTVKETEPGAPLGIMCGC